MIKKIIQTKVFRNFSYLTIGSIISQLLMLVTVLKITNAFSTEQYGLYSFIIAQGMLVYTLSDLGVKAVTIRGIARNPLHTNDYVVNGAKIRLIALFAVVLLYLVYNNFLGQLSLLQILLLTALGLIHSTFYLFEYVFLGYQKMLVPSLIKIGHSSLWFLIVVILPKEYFTVELLLVLFIISNLIQSVILLVVLKKDGLLQGKTLNFFSSSKALLSESWPYIALMLLTLPYSYFSNNLLDINSNRDEIAYFNLAKKLMGPVQIIITFSITAIFPNISAMFEQNYAKFKGLISDGTYLFILLIALFSFLFTMFSKEAVELLFEEKYYPAILVIQLQVWFVFFNGINHLIATILGAANLEKYIFKLAVVNFVVSVPMLYYGSKFGAMGISYAYVLSFALYEIYLWIQFKNLVNIKIKNDILVWILALIMFFISYFISQELNLFVKSLISIFMVGILYFLFFKKSTFNFLKR
ncbi:oligosaccharide flippase family protein [Pararhodonellum marinum]|uniref:oligosaccharide flippase family protein n=1 Tax=Pararhodonellum marinum TaxID=2755358 RepID=UPI00188DDE45|nr:oligosaccharide flippase family protein [Pararhodonellum marinum]